MSTKRPKEYISNKHLYQMIIDWYATDKEDPPIELVKGIMQICTRLGTRHNFRNYTWNEDMVQNGIEACFKALKLRKFDPEKSQNPFAYFTMIAYNEARKVINLEKKESYIKHKSMERHFLESILLGVDVEVPETDDSGRIEALIEKFEKKNE